MFSFTKTAAITVGIMMAVLPAIALGSHVGEKGNGLSICDEQYLHLYKQADELGWPLGKNVVKETDKDDQQVCKQVEKLEAAIAALTTPAPTTTEEPVETTSAPAPATSGGAGGDLASIRACESGGDYTTNTGNGYYGAYQFDLQTWQAAGGTGNPASASPAEQDAVAAAWIAAGHRSAWPNC